MLTMLSREKGAEYAMPAVREFLEKLTHGEGNTGEFAVAEIKKDDWPEEVSMVISIDRGLAKNIADFSDFLSHANVVEGPSISSVPTSSCARPTTFWPKSIPAWKFSSASLPRFS